ncbi:hypothetical protein BKM31_17645 [[Actinomadura] parvosata subsp. kistnae]|uniref:Uncharacterized protein n=1 Tax=[Actinomadura] parvosata subsp. kistnae TaxID=1909395 RepID=A0A1U9ZYL1_9ACTN|nr:hypothetical protein BKM31_17645 [Nonomuraea sp. ATCC 55076]
MILPVAWSAHRYQPVGCCLQRVSPPLQVREVDRSVVRLQRTYWAGRGWARSRLAPSSAVQNVATCAASWGGVSHRHTT